MHSQKSAKDNEMGIWNMENLTPVAFVSLQMDFECINNSIWVLVLIAWIL